MPKTNAILKSIKEVSEKVSQNKIKYCACCGSHKLEYLNEEIACDDCGAVLKIKMISEPQPELINKL